ncbi:Transcriptional regulator, PadR family [Fulvivirga imtechensis AK7]|uniref:Transcriptional regulator, PadR family n=1 Tax=Fulvivirga imtechensis AK7 TaxID=1237149 RepID=L8JIA8_9BACT|nr:PadR family transcriptional regulator [Fulvivirga imtechensis]ELR68560.1 Transcriptional regulator, PadR family [Fulvivirga imtechensis AK7]
MKLTQLGEFEELVLLVVGALGDEAYGVTVKQEIESQTGRKPSIGALHSALNRLETKGFINSHEGGATNERGGRRKRYYQLTASGKRALLAAHELRSNLISRVPGLSLGGSLS